MLAIMLLMVAGTRTLSDHAGTVQQSASKSKEIGKDFSKKQASQSPESNEAKVSTLSLDAVITPAISFDFSHYFYFSPQPAWQFIVSKAVVRVSFQESFFLVSHFHRIFGRFIVTNAP
ncbi:hypothetical protein [Dyadobacter sp. CY323]|uniref:hypothetical protein n=1 Tax=Dyadobacter sp. CY323 TaxID=2907302 RepID=UPI001F313B77|nr:hypothetical protein [Dyadobacter sp. CY323]MCE6988880.1 hypothetical protein [Dyadobacter sp. CY323]